MIFICISIHRVFFEVYRTDTVRCSKVYFSTFFGFWSADTSKRHFSKLTSRSKGNFRSILADRLTPNNRRQTVRDYTTFPISLETALDDLKGYRFAKIIMRLSENFKDDATISLFIWKSYESNITSRKFLLQELDHVVREHVKTLRRQSVWKLFSTISVA